MDDGVNNSRLFSTLQMKHTGQRYWHSSALWSLYFLIHFLSSVCVRVKSWAGRAERGSRGESQTVRAAYDLQPKVRTTSKKSV